MEPRKVSWALMFGTPFFALGWFAQSHFQIMNEGTEGRGAVAEPSRGVAASVSDQVRVSSAHSEMALSAPLASPSPVPMLAGFAIHELRKAYYDKLTALESSDAFKRYGNYVSEPSNLQEVVDAFHRTENPGGLWIGRFFVSLEGRNLNALSIFEFTDTTENAPTPLGGTQVSPSVQFCWFVRTYFPGTTDLWATAGKCTDAVATRNGKYFATQNINIDPIEAAFTHLALEMPFGENSGEAEILDTKTQKWIKAGPVTWTPATPEETQQVEREAMETR